MPSLYTQTIEYASSSSWKLSLLLRGSSSSSIIYVARILKISVTRLLRFPL
ncbi:unnamed protein product [Arabidopsis halleri]